MRLRELSARLALRAVRKLTLDRTATLIWPVANLSSVHLTSEAAGSGTGACGAEGAVAMGGALMGTTFL